MWRLAWAWMPSSSRTGVCMPWQIHIFLLWLSTPARRWVFITPWARTWLTGWALSVPSWLELTLPELRKMAKRSKIELEIFVHGALCYSFSGMCLFSSYLGGMSANRGQCRQPCRRQYSTSQNTSFLFSLKDNQLMGQLPKLLQLPISSLKIEGRMKSAEYVYTVASAYRMAVDNPEKLPKPWSCCAMIWDAVKPAISSVDR